MTTSTHFTIILQSDLFRLDGHPIDLCKSLINLCDCINNDPIETDWSLGESMDCTLDSLLVGAYWALTACHAGQASESYAALCSIGTIFSPGMTCGPEEESSEKMVYDMVCEYLIPGSTVKAE